MVTLVLQGATSEVMNERNGRLLGLIIILAFVAFSAYVAFVQLWEVYHANQVRV